MRHSPRVYCNMVYGMPHCNATFGYERYVCDICMARDKLRAKRPNSICGARQTAPFSANQAMMVMRRQALEFT
jgi:hypothetical protein